MNGASSLVPRRARVLLAIALVISLPPREAAGQFAEPCSVACALTLGATGFTAATGAVVAVARLEGGLSTTSQGLWIWGTSFGLIVGGGVALSGNGERQRRAVYGAGVTLLSGSLVGAAIESVRTRGEGTRTLAGALAGAALGAVVGGVYGALSYDEASASGAVPFFSIRLPI